ncbi:MAG: BppU family phage baseplate upper protein [Christensenellales bacterium]
MNWTINQTVDLSRGYTPVVWPDALMVSGDVGAHTWRLTVLDNGNPVDLSGATITGNFLRADGNTVTVAGTVSGNIASVTLTDVCYAVEGKLKGTIKMTKSGAVITLAAVIFTVSLFTSGSVIAPGVAYADFQIDASPRGVYADLAALNAGTPTAPDVSKIYITDDDNKWCYHNGAAWVAGGVYQAFSYNPLEYQMSDSVFLETGAFDAVGAKEVALSRTRTAAVHILDTDITIQAKTGWKIYIIICDVDGVRISGSGWVTTAQTISGGSYFNLVIARVNDAIHPVADAADALRCDLPSSMLVQAKYGRAVMKIYDADTADFVSMTITQDGNMIFMTY